VRSGTGPPDFELKQTIWRAYLSVVDQPIAPRRLTAWCVLSFCLLLLLGGCVGIAAGNSQEREWIRTVGIISAFDDMFHVQKIGLMVSATICRNSRSVPGVWTISSPARCALF
jgi:hypothetical protein